ncbi:MAG: PA14 domain-containing protein, partial [Acidimicrobiales bacterium]
MAISQLHFHSARRHVSLGRKTATIVAAVSMLATLPALASSVSAAPAKPTGPKEVPALPTPSLAKVAPEKLKGDFTDPPPHPADLAKVRPAKAKASFDPAKSTPIDAETTATKKVYLNADGTRTERITTRPARFRNAKGAWAEIDLTLVPSADGTLVARSAERSAKLAATANGATTVETSAGTIALRHPDASPSPAVPRGDTATYARALGRRDLLIAVTPDGVEETVVVPDIAAGGSYVDELTLPAGLSARDGAGGVELVDSSGTVVARFDNGWAYDESRTTAPVPVAVRLASPATTATVAVNVSVDPAYLADPARVFPVTIDPTLSRTGTTDVDDAMVINGGSANINYATYPQVWAGTGGADSARTYLRFNNMSAPAGAWVSDAKIYLWNLWSSCVAPRPLEVGAPMASWAEPAITWNNQPSFFDPSSGTSTPNPALGSAPNCDAGGINLDVTWLASRWLSGSAPNYGVVIKDAAEGQSPGGYRQFYSSEAAAYPALVVTYSTGAAAPMAQSASPSPADGEVITTTTPTLAVAKLADPNGQPVRYWFRGTPSPDAETGAKVIDSGWLKQGDVGLDGCATVGSACAYKVPDGVLHDGLTYSWHAWTYDYVSNWTMASWVGTFSVDLHLGAADPLPRDQVGPAQVNLASGNLVVGASTRPLAAVGGPVGLDFSYNSAAPTTSRVGLTGSYYTVPASPVPPAMPSAGTPAAMTRLDPSVNFWWASSSPAPVLAPTNFAVRWEGFVTVPFTGAYRFGASSDDGAKIWVDNQLIVDKWLQQSSWPTPNYGVPIQMTAGVAKAIKIEYFQGTGASFMHLMANGPSGTAGAMVEGPVPATWLAPTTSTFANTPLAPALPPGWTLAPSGVDYVSARVADRALVLTDPSGSTTTWNWSGSGGGFVPDQSSDGIATVDVNGAIVVHADGGRTYSFKPWGGLDTLTSVTDDGRNTALLFNWSAGTPSSSPRLVSITDQLGDDDVATSRPLDLHYGTDTFCPTPATGYVAAPAAMVCGVRGWDGTNTYLAYKGAPAPQLARITIVGNATIGDEANEFGYDAAGRMETIRTPLQHDAVAWGTPDDDTSRSKVIYDTAGRVTSVTLAIPNSLGAPAHRYTYGPAVRDVTVNVDGLSPRAGAARHVVWEDDPGRMTANGARTAFERKPGIADIAKVTDTDANGLVSTAVYDYGDRLVSSTDPAGRRRGARYDADPTLHLSGRVTDSYGAGPSACLGENGTPAACSATPSHEATTYDTTYADPNVAGGAQWTGLGATWWDNAANAGSPRAHTTPVATTSMVSAPPSGINPAYSARFTGEVIIPVPPPGISPIYGFGLRLVGKGRVFVDDRLVTEAWSSHPSVANVDGPNVTLAAGRHRIRVDYAAEPGAVAELRWKTPTAAFGALPLASLAPRYSRAVRTVADDTTAGVTSRNEHTNFANPADGLPTTMTTDWGTAAKLNLATNHTYDTKARLDSRALPAGAGTARSYTYYGPSGTGSDPMTNGCGATAGTNQNGALKTSTGPDPDGTAGSLVNDYVYDAAGRTLGTQVRGGGGWACVTYDARGRLATQTFPAFGGFPGRTLTYDYAPTVAPATTANPLITKVTEVSG